MEFDFTVLNWNIGGAKYLELRKKEDLTRPNEVSREANRYTKN